MSGRLTLEPALVRHAVSSQEVWRDIGRLQISRADFDDAAMWKAVQFATEHREKYGELPSIDVVQQVCRIDLDQPESSAGFILESFQDRRLFRQISGLKLSIENALESNDPKRAHRVISEYMNRPRLMLSGGPVSLFELGETVLENYRKVASGETGVPFMWPKLTKACNGLLPGHTTLFVARPGVGKTWTLILQARHAWMNGHRVLIISPEMPKEEVAERFFVVDGGVPYGQVIRGELATGRLEGFERYIEEMQLQKGVWIMDSRDDLSRESIDSAIALVQPDLVGIDAIYRMRWGRDKTERTIAALEYMDDRAKMFEVPFVGMHQQSRDAEVSTKRGGGNRLGTIALTDQAGWDAYNVFALGQDADMKADRLILVEPMKVRRGVVVEAFRSHWDFDEHRYHELGSEEPAKRFVDEGFKEDDGVPF